MNYTAAVQEDARLRILQALAEQVDHRLSDLMLVNVLDGWGYRRSREFVRTHVRKLQELGAVQLLRDTPELLIPELTVAGLDHVQRRSVIDGVKRPEPGE